jgi:Ser/Thr protein kinase RdoA (MazF antagonist)
LISELSQLDQIMTDERFPVIYSTLTTEALIDRVLSAYAIEAVVRCRFWSRGLSDIYLVETAAHPYILRVSHSHWRSQADIEFELALLDFLYQRRIPVAYPLRTKTGDLAVTVAAPEGSRYASLFIYAPGQVALGDLNPTQSQILGETVANLHLAGQDFCPAVDRQPLTLEYLIDDSLHLIAPFLQHRSADLTYLQAATAQIKQQLQDFPQEPPFWGICWGDPHSGNVHFTANNQVTLFDFDQCGYGWRMFEIAKFWQVSLCTGASRTIRDAFLTGYQSVQPITAVEMQALQTFTQVAQIWRWAISVNHAMIHNYSRLDEHYFKVRLEQLKMLRSPDWQLF